ncbi:60S ribosomal protein L26-like [Talpa occidentalis]|uniref:60S ribosomal protein L26-like n=1 Tax=Talpa occidentalis TaxID=50954 RepID=UPI00188F88FB|nr:60S ribosomal protein L26-like [Talpa occidentalis]
MVNLRFKPLGSWTVIKSAITTSMPAPTCAGTSSQPALQEAVTEVLVPYKPTHKDREVHMLQRHYKGQQMVHRKKYVIYVGWAQGGQADRTSVQMGIHPSKLGITSPKTDEDGEKLLNAKPNLNELEKRKANIRKN